VTYKPEVRRDELTIREVGPELVVYDARHQRAHRLNKAAAPILRASDGTRTVDQIAFLLSHDLGAKERTELVWVTLQDLSQADLLKAAITPPGDLDRSRRNLLQKAAVIGLALPVVESVIAQPAKAHDSDRRGWDHDHDHDHDDR
jgi:hypothetical protein